MINIPNPLLSEFKGRYDLVLAQMKKRNAPQAQYEQLEQIKKRWEIITEKHTLIIF